MVNPLKKFFSRRLDALQRGQIQFQPNSLIPGRLFEVLDSRLAPVFVSGGDVHFGVLG